jgi:hypothetical protein
MELSALRDDGAVVTYAASSGGKKKQLDRIAKMMDYECSFAPKWDTLLLKIICSHHAENSKCYPKNSKNVCLAPCQVISSAGLDCCEEMDSIAAIFGYVHPMSDASAMRLQSMAK